MAKINPRMKTNDANPLVWMVEKFNKCNIIKLNFNKLILFIKISSNIETTCMHDDWTGPREEYAAIMPSVMIWLAGITYLVWIYLAKAWTRQPKGIGDTRMTTSGEFN